MGKNYNNKSKSRNRKGKDLGARTKDRSLNTKGKGDFEERGYSKSENDSSWYTRNQQLALDAGRLAFTYPIGKPIDLGTHQVTTPGIMVLNTAATVGHSIDNSSAVNVAARNMYSFVRHANSGHSNYDSQDLMLYLLAMDSVYSFYATLTRLYGTLAIYSQRNRYLPKALVQAMGFNFDDCLANIADLRYYINQCAVKIGSLCVPNTLSYYARHIWMYSGIYSDSLSEKAQIYLYHMSWYHVFDEISGAGALRAVEFNPDMTFDEARTIMDTMIANIIQSEDMNIMSGDILKAFGQENLIKLSQITENYVVAPMYSEEVLEQIQNTTVLPKMGLPDFNITQDPTTGAIINELKGAVDGGGTTAHDSEVANAIGSLYTDRQILAAHEESPSPERVLVMSRLTLGCSYDSTNGNLTIKHCASEICVSVKLYWIDSNGDAAGHLMYGTLFVSTNAYNPHYDIQSGFAAAANLSVFAHHPMFRLIFTSSSNVGVNYFFDVENMTTVGVHELEKLHETSVLSMFNVPQMGAAWTVVKQ